MPLSRNSKRSLRDVRYLLCACLLLLIVMFILPFHSAESYSIVRNTTSHLGAQNTPNAWVMNSIFALAGASCVVEAWLHLGKFWFHKLLLSIFGLSLLLTGNFQHAPIAAGVPFDGVEDQLHSIFATAVGFSFTVLAISTAFIEKTKRQRITDLSVGIAATMLSALMSYLPEYSGVWQRAIFVMAFTWLVFVLERMRRLESC